VLVDRDTRTRGAAEERISVLPTKKDSRRVTSPLQRVIFGPDPKAALFALSLEQLAVTFVISPDTIAHDEWGT